MSCVDWMTRKPFQCFFFFTALVHMKLFRVLFCGGAEKIEICKICKIAFTKNNKKQMGDQAYWFYKVTSDKTTQTKTSLFLSRAELAFETLSAVLLFLCAFGNKLHR